MSVMIPPGKRWWLTFDEVDGLMEHEVLIARSAHLVPIGSEYVGTLFVDAVPEVDNLTRIRDHARATDDAEALAILVEYEKRLAQMTTANGGAK